MKLVTLAVAGFVVVGASPALAQYGLYGPPMRPGMPVAGIGAADVVSLVRDMGLDPVGPPLRDGPVYVQRAADYYGKPLRVVIDAARAQVVSVEPAAMPERGHVGAYPVSAGPYGRRLYPAYGALPPADDDIDLAPPGSVMAPRAQPPHAALPPPHVATQAPHLAALPPRAGAQPTVQPAKPAAKTAAVTPAKPPVPRKRPDTAPQQAAGSVEPLQPATPPAAQSAPAQASPPMAQPQAKPGEPIAFPPYAPLE